MHPGEQPGHELMLMCDDLGATIAELKAKGVEFRDGTTEARFGTTATMILPGAVEVMLYEPRHPTAI